MSYVCVCAIISLLNARDLQCSHGPETEDQEFHRFHPVEISLGAPFRNLGKSCSAQQMREDDEYKTYAMLHCITFNSSPLHYIIYIT